jgi:hypothetical protein
LALPFVGINVLGVWGSKQNNALSLFPKANVLISLATPRADSIHYNDSAELHNAMLKRKFRNIKNILLCDNSNMSYKGTPKSFTSEISNNTGKNYPTSNRDQNS